MGAGAGWGAVACGSVLREAGLIEQWKQGTSKFSTLRRADIDARFPGLLDSVLQTVPV